MTGSIVKRILAAGPRGLSVSICTPDDLEDLKGLIDLKVDAITTNRPDVLKRLVDSR
jgi:glycerophosphoryl diester phosphodiesterase